MSEIRSQIEETQPIEQKETGKAVPFPVKRGWVGVPNAIFTVYTKHPDMNSTAIVVYEYLLHRYNDKFGYAYPSQAVIAIDLGVSTGTVKAAVARLKKVGLIDVKYSVQYNNNHYRFPPVCETVEELAERFPEISEHLAKLSVQAEAIRVEAEKDRYRLQAAFRGESDADG